MSKRLSISVFSILILLTLTYNSFACACCAEKGTYSIATGKPDPITLEILSDMKFGAVAQLYTDAAGFEAIKGLDPIKNEADLDSFDVVSAFMNKTWKVTIKSSSGRQGVLTLTLPAQVVNFKVDTHDSPAGQEVSLYKELRFKGTISGGTGIFQGGIIKPTSYFLVFQGRGNMCDNASDYTHWRLEINGRKADYAFFGSMGQ